MGRNPQGPTAVKVLQPMVEEDLSKVYFSDFLKLAIKGVPNCYLTRTGCTPAAHGPSPLHICAGLTCSGGAPLLPTTPMPRSAIPVTSRPEPCLACTGAISAVHCAPSECVR